MTDTIRTPVQENFSVSGEIMHGKHLGRTLGFPTANLECPTGADLPPNGVHIASMEIFTGPYAGQTLPCVLNQGRQPTAPSGIATVEAHVLDFSGDLYGAQITLRYICFLRPETKFASLDALKAQLALDAQRAREYFTANPL